jgi:hypothetical protein
MTDTEEKEIAENLIRLRLEKEPDLDSELVRRVFMLSLSQGPLGAASKVPFGEDTSQKALDKFVLLKDADNDSESGRCHQLL